MTVATRIPFDELTLGTEQRSFYGGIPFTGTAFEVFPSGALQGETPFVGGLEEGIYRTWSESGQLIAEGEKWNGVLHGRSRKWDENGRMVSEQWFEYGIKVLQTTWSSTGEVATWRISTDESAMALLEASRAKFGGAPPVVLPLGALEK